ncbi:MAG: hypothetical protein ACOX3R_13540 [Desulfitobacteriia bacterium]|jgi:hypothetical protein
MQNRYVGDIGDFGKYHLLKSLCKGSYSEQDMALGVIWYLVPDETHNDDGKHIRYLQQTNSNQTRFRIGDPALYDSLAEIIKGSRRDISLIRENKVLPEATVFYEAPLSFEGMPNNTPAARNRRIDFRKNWINKALEMTEGCDLIFVDPDNGLEVNSVKSYQNKGPKYTYFEELIPFVKRGQSLVIYHHLCRSGSAEEQVKKRLDQLKERLGVDDIYPLLYKRGTLRTFFIVPSLRHTESLKERAIRLTQIAPWKEHFSMLPAVFKESR